MRSHLPFGRRIKNDSGAQIVEFAVSLPLLVVFVVGIFDFSGAFTLKQKLTNVARDAARVAAADPANDVSSSTALPASVADAYQVVMNYFAANQLNSCSMTSSSYAATSPTWTYSSSGNACPSPGLKIIINRGYYFPQTGAQAETTNCASQTIGSQTAVIATCVSIQYAYQWQFGKVVTLLGRAQTLPTTINAAAVAMNEN